MALELIHGPSVIRDAGDVAVPNLERYMWDDAVGLMSVDSLLNYFVTQLDGNTHLRGEGRKINFVIDMQKERPEQYLTARTTFMDRMNLFDKKSGTRGDVVIVQGAINLADDMDVRLEDRFLSVIGSTVSFRPLDGSADKVAEATLPGRDGGFTASWSRTLDLDVLALVYDDGVVLHYNHKTKQQVGTPTHVGSNDGCWFSKKHNIWVKVTDNAGTSEISIYANTPVPVTLTNPAGAAVVQGSVTTFSVTVTGSNSEPVINEIIDWSLEAGSLGSLSVTQSKTNSNGVAVVDYIPPANTTGGATIKAELSF